MEKIIPAAEEGFKLAAHESLVDEALTERTILVGGVRQDFIKWDGSAA